MAYMNQERKAKIVAAAKPILKKYGVKGTFRCSQHSITLTVTGGKIDFVEHMNADADRKEKFRQDYVLDVNPYWYHDHYTGVAKDFFDEIIPALQAADWYDRSDAMVDHFDTAYYYHLNVGSWYKPYILTY